jgi:hypothetical protein
MNQKKYSCKISNVLTIFTSSTMILGSVNAAVIYTPITQTELNPAGFNLSAPTNSTLSLDAASPSGTFVTFQPFSNGYMNFDFTNNDDGIFGATIPDRGVYASSGDLIDSSNNYTTSGFFGFERIFSLATYNGETFYIGIRAELSPGNYNYGWISVDGYDFSGNNNNANKFTRITGFAYESTANTAIEAGSTTSTVPEAGTLGLLASSFTGLLALRRRHAN